MGIFLTFVPDLDKYEKSLDRSAITQTDYSPDFNTWMDGHNSHLLRSRIDVA